MDLKQRILTYIHHLDDSNYLRSAIEGIKLEILYQAIADLLRSGNAETVLNASVFAEDLCVRSPDDIKAWFRTGLYESEVITALQENLFLKDHFIREGAAHTLGKIGSIKSSTVLRQALTQFKESDPLLMGPLMFEIEWLEKQRDWRLIDELLACSGFITRWVAISLLKPTRGLVGTQYFEEIRSRLSRMREDPSPFVRAEVEFRSRQFQFCEESLHVPKATRSKQRAALKKLKPKISIDHLHVQFFNYWSSLTKQEYCAADVESFVQKLTQ